MRMGTTSETGSGPTWGDVVREVFPEASDAQAEYLLWERTAFPFADVDHVRQQLLEDREHYGPILRAANEARQALGLDE